MPKYKFTEEKVTTITLEDCECEQVSPDPCDECDKKAWEAFNKGDGSVQNFPVEWEVA